LPSELIVHSDFYSEVLHANRTVVVYLPPGYRRDTRRLYPVLYLHDGQNIFDPSTAYVPGQHWRLRESADDLIARRRIEPLVMAALYHGGARRLFEYTPTKTRKLGGGGLTLHARVLGDELRWWIRRHYRVLPQARNTALAGSSLGGLATLCLGLRFPEVFGRLAVMSPSVWWDHRVVLKYVEALRHTTRQKIWLDVGTNEGDSPFSSVRDVRLLRAMLVSRGWRDGGNLHYQEAAGADHNERAWAARAPQMLEFLFPRKAKARKKP
jgi:predicted alpha/beta superfamily hydrolase